jgi:hypothetical protein
MKVTLRRPLAILKPPHPRVLFDVRPPHYHAIMLLPMLSTP